LAASNILAFFPRRICLQLQTRFAVARQIRDGMAVMQRSADRSFGSQRAAQGLALDPVGHGNAVAVHVGQGRAGGEEHPDDFELELAGSGGAARAGRCDREV
jgi:hypothetical protein